MENEQLLAQIASKEEIAYFTIGGSYYNGGSDTFVKQATDWINVLEAGSKDVILLVECPSKNKDKLVSRLQEVVDFVSCKPIVVVAESEFSSHVKIKMCFDKNKKEEHK